MTDTHLLRYDIGARGRLFPQDWLILGYCGLLILLIALVGRPLGDYLDEILTYAAMAAGTLAIVFFINGDHSRLTAFIRICYPAFLFTFFYRVTGGLMSLLFDGFMDWQLTTFEKLILGVHPTLYIDQYLLSDWLSELFLGCYFCYYFMIPGFVLWIFFRRDYRILRQGLTAICLTFFLSYPLFFIYPIEGPRWFFADLFTNDIDGPFFVQMVHAVMHAGAVRGGCMPSTHTGVALVIMFFCFKYYRPMGWVLLPINLGLAIGTFWGRFHYASDVFVGAAIAVIATSIVFRDYDRWERADTIRPRRPQPETTHAT